MREDRGPFNLQVGDKVCLRNGWEGVVVSEWFMAGSRAVQIHREGFTNDVGVWAGGKADNRPGIVHKHDVISVGEPPSIEEYL